jgi:L-rhamnose mutarotase
MIRKAFAMKVHPDKHAEYERRHSTIQVDLEAVLKSHGVSRYSLFLNQKTSGLFAYAEIESEEKWDAIAKTEACRKWWAFMKDIKPSNSDNSSKSEPLHEIFHLD